ncbi:GNAT family N-acetyltransferase [uncultured Arcticibacterium sp.]|uniref:GNAT family N-acetyltransferase n=1 Tax=uncultured Arcticibacterium sp. TaxID=2173042 RepID=UPI0030F63E55
MITYREASKNDYKEIARIHASSWKKHYKGIVPDYLLTEKLDIDRLAIWKERLKKSNANQRIILALDQNKIIGFSCIYLHHSSGYGALLDNLHVLSSHQGKGIGLILMQKSFDWVFEMTPEDQLYLTVLSKNEPAKSFYYKIGGSFQEEYMEEFPKGNSILVQRISWNKRPTL